MDLDLEPRTGASDDALHLKVVGLIGNAVAAGAAEIGDLGRIVAWRLLQGIAKQIRRDEFALDPAAAAVGLWEIGVVMGRAPPTSIRNQPLR